jgi:hypothetical protein
MILLATTDTRTEEEIKKELESCKEVEKND